MNTEPKNCLTCNRGARFVEGCSHVECPQRRVLSAQPVGEPFLSTGAFIFVREPTTKGDE